MNNFSHQDQQKIWDAEHAEPQILLQMDSDKPSSGVTQFYEYLRGKNMGGVGVEMGCGKGRNVTWLALQDGVTKMHGLDFSPNAVQEAKRRAELAEATKAEFRVCDVTERWPLGDGTVDFVVDCFASTDIETPEARRAAVSEGIRVLRPDGAMLAYVLSTEDEFHKEMIEKSPAEERNSFYHPSTGKFEKTFDAEELEELHDGLTLVESRRIEKEAEFFGKQYHCRHFWNVYKKP